MKISQNNKMGNQTKKKMIGFSFIQSVMLQ